MTVLPPPPEQTVQILLRLTERVPDDCPHPPEAVVTGLMAFLSGMTWTDDKGLYPFIESLCTIPGKRGAARTIATWRGALQLLSFPTPEAWVEQAERAEEKFLAATPPGDWTPWFCVFCERSWASGLEPDACPDCDHPLIRLQSRPLALGR